MSFIGPNIAPNQPSYLNGPYMQFHIIIHAYNVVVPSTIIDEGTFFSIMSSTTWKDLGSL